MTEWHLSPDYVLDFWTEDQLVYYFEKRSQRLKYIEQQQPVGAGETVVGSNKQFAPGSPGMTFNQAQIPKHEPPRPAKRRQKSEEELKFEQLGFHAEDCGSGVKSWSI